MVAKTVSILYDADVAEAVRKLLGAPTRPKRLARLRLRFALSEYSRLEKRIQKLSSEPLEPQVAQAVESYREYYQAMKKVIRAARAYLSTTNN